MKKNRIQNIKKYFTQYHSINRPLKFMRSLIHPAKVLSAYNKPSTIRDIRFDNQVTGKDSERNFISGGAKGRTEWNEDLGMI